MSRRSWIATMVAVGAVTVVWVATADSPKPKPTPKTKRDLFAVYAADCPGNAADTDPRCSALRTIVTQRLLRNLEYLESAGDGRGIAPAVDALDLDDPEIQEISLRVIGPFTSDPAVQGVLRSKVLPLLFGNRVTNQGLAAEVLEASGDAFGYLGAQFKAGHAELADHYKLPPADAISPAPTVTGKLVPYPGATRYPPGESDRSIAVMTTASVDQVVASLGKVKTYNHDDWVTFVSTSKAYEQTMPLDTDPLFLEMQRVMKQYEAKPDPKLTEKLAALQTQLEAKMKKWAVDHAYGALAMSRPRLSKDEKMAASARWLVLENRGERVARMVIVYRDDLLARTVEMLLWDPQYYPRNPIHNEPNLNFSE